MGASIDGMSSRIEPLFQKLERQKAAVLLDISTWSAERLRGRPSPDAWCALDVLDHLWKAEAAFVDAVKENLPEGHPIAWPEHVGAFFVTWVMRSPLRVKVPPSAASVMPQSVTDASAIAGCWSRVRDEMAELLGSLSPQQLPRGLFRHPVSGWMNLPRAMSFLSAHLRHHQYQIARLERASRGRYAATYRDSAHPS